MLRSCVLLCAFSALAAAQISGSVLDPNGAGVGGAKVTLKRSAGAAIQFTVADSKGGFHIERVAPGDYDLQVEQDKFKTSVSRVHMGEQPPDTLRIVLELAQVQQEVTVTAQMAQVNTNAADNLDTVTLDRSALDNLPIFDQDYIGTMSRFLDASSLGTNGVTLVVDGVEATRAGVSASAIQEVKI